MTGVCRVSQREALLELPVLVIQLSDHRFVSGLWGKKGWMREPFKKFEPTVEG